MPIYGFTCDTCGKEFQTLVRASETPECPSCGKTALTRQLSLIASPAKGGDTAGTSFASESGGAPAGFPPPESVLCRLVESSGHIIFGSDAPKLIAMRDAFAGTVHLLESAFNEAARLRAISDITLQATDCPDTGSRTW